MRLFALLVLYMSYNGLVFCLFPNANSVDFPHLFPLPSNGGIYFGNSPKIERGAADAAPRGLSADWGDQYMPPFRAAISKQTRFVQYFNGNDENSKLLFENCSKVVAGMFTHFYKNLRVSTDKMRKSPRKKHLI